MPVHKILCKRLSLNNLLCIDRCRLRGITQRNCRDCIYYQTLRCETLKKRFTADRPGDINY